MNIVKSLLEEAFPCSHLGRPRTEFSLILDAVLYVLRTGCQWRMLRHPHVSWQTAHRHFERWSKKGIFETAYHHLVSLYIKKYQHIRKATITDTSFIKNVYGRDCVGPSPVDRGRKATKLSIITDECGVVLAASFHKANKADFKAFLHTLTQSQQTIDFSRNKAFYADRAYDNARCDAVVAHTGMINRCARRRRKKGGHCTATFPAIRSVVEHAFAWLDKFRRLILRYDRMIVHHKSFTYLALTYRILKFL